MLQSVINRTHFPRGESPGFRREILRSVRLTPPRFLPIMGSMYRPGKVKRFDLPAGRIVAGKYEIERPLGSGWEGEVYVIRDRSTGIRRAAKFYYPHRDPMGKAAIIYARKLDALRHCPILMQYHHQETVTVQKKRVMVVISELVEGRKLSEFLADQPDQQLSSFEALHVLYALVKGIAPIHARGEYHGDIHDDNIMIRRQGITFEVKLLDFFDLGRPTRSKIHKDVLNLIQVFHTIIGGRQHYAKQPRVVKDIIRGLKDSLILDRFKSAGDIQRHLESLEW
jgi:tRNA A-37 threonylcarbamoyl transferase component Bud32